MSWVSTAGDPKGIAELLKSPEAAKVECLAVGVRSCNATIH